MLKQQIEELKHKENETPAGQSAQHADLTLENKGDEEFQGGTDDIEDDDGEYETEESEAPESPGVAGTPQSMFENLLRNHGLLGQREGSRSQSTGMPRDDLHPVTSQLSVGNLDDCVQLENVSFPKEERASREKFAYRLKKCPELCFGVSSQPTLAASTKNPSSPSSKTIVAHIIATRTTADTVTDAAMALPADWESKIKASEREHPEEGHQDQGKTVCIHSLAVLPEHRGKRVGSMLMQAYTERIKSSKIADRIALLAHDDLIPFYEKFGFKNVGPSKAQFGGGNWVDMVLEFDHTREDDE